MSALTVLTLIFVVLKLTGHIDWSWWLVVSPILLHASIVFVAILIGVFESPEAKMRRAIKKKYGLD